MNAWQPLSSLSSLWINLGFHRFEVNLGLKGGSDMLRSTQMSARKCQKPSTWGPKSRPSSGVSTTSSTHGTQRGCVGNFTHPPKCGMPSCESGEAWRHDETRAQHGTAWHSKHYNGLWGSHWRFLLGTSAWCSLATVPCQRRWGIQPDEECEATWREVSLLQGTTRERVRVKEFQNLLKLEKACWLILLGKKMFWL
jgi:hypothetical protein